MPYKWERNINYNSSYLHPYVRLWYFSRAFKKDSCLPFAYVVLKCFIRMNLLVKCNGSPRLAVVEALQLEVYLFLGTAYEK